MHSPVRTVEGKTAVLSETSLHACENGGFVHFFVFFSLLVYLSGASKRKKMTAGFTWGPGAV